jgi:hypothetical protein
MSPILFQWSGTAFTDNYKRNRNPTPNKLTAELKGVAWTCATSNAACATKIVDALADEDTVTRRDSE